MAAPVADTYSAPSGASVYGGRYQVGGRASGAALLAGILAGGGMATNASELAGAAVLDGISASGGATGLVWPAWRTGVVANTWVNVTNGATLSDIDPNVAPNDITPSGADWIDRGMTAGLLSWVGGAWDEAGGEFWIPVGGGHTDYGGNEPYKINLLADAPTWVMVRPPSGAVPPGSALTTRDGLETSGVYSDGRIRAQHTYYNCLWVPGYGAAITRGSSMHVSGAGSITKVNLLDSAGEATMVCDYSGVANPGGSIGMAAWDTSRSKIWITSRTTSSGILSIDPSTWAVTQHGTATWASASDGWHYCPLFDALLGVNHGTLKTFNIGAGSYSPGTPTQSAGSFSAGWSITSSTDGFGSCWCEDLGVMALYQNVSNTTEISTLTPTGALNDPWTKGVLTVDGGNLVTPPVSPADGYMNRFFYSSRLKGFFAIPSTTEDVYFFATQ